MSEPTEPLERHGWQKGMFDAAQLLAVYPDGCTATQIQVLINKRREILAAAGILEPIVHNLGDGVVARLSDAGSLRLSYRFGDGTEDIIVIGKEACENLVRFIREHIAVCKDA